MGYVGRLLAVVLGLVAAAGPSAAFTSRETLDAAYDQGLARTPDGWVVSGRNVLARLDDQLTVVRAVDPAIPPEWAQRGFDHVGDIDVSGSTVYVPFEQPDYERGRQAMARYDADTLRFLDATTVDQHENSFVAVDGDSGIAYSMDRFGGGALLRYDVRAGWRSLAPLRMDRKLARVQGAAVAARDAIWLLTDDEHQGLYRVDIDSGAVTDLGSARPLEGEAEGIDAAAIATGDLHATVVAADRRSVGLGHFLTSAGSDAVRSSSAGSDTSWPPTLVYFTILLVVAALGAVGTMFWRARTTLRPKR